MVKKWLVSLKYRTEKHPFQYYGKTGSPVKSKQEAKRFTTRKDAERVAKNMKSENCSAAVLPDA